MTRTIRFAFSAVALLALLALVVGIPIGLALAVGLPFPDPWPTPSELSDMAAGRAPVPADLVISILALVMWLLWFQVAWAAVVEVLAAVRGRLARRAPVLPGLQLTIGKLVTTATLLTSGLSARPVAAGPLPAVAAVAQIDDGFVTPAPSESSNGATTSRSSGPSLRAYETEPGDTWWGIAEDVYGSGPRWKEIRNLNLGRTMEDGSVISVATDLLRPQWRLLLPAVAGSPTPSVQATGVSAVAGSADTVVDGPEVVVEAGDTIWALAEADLEDLGRETSNVVVAERVDEIAEINRAEIGGDPDVIFPGQRLELPARPALAERAPAVTPDPTSDTPPDGAPSSDAPPDDTPPDDAPPDGAGPADGDETGSEGDEAATSEPMEMEPPSDDEVAATPLSPAGDVTVAPDEPAATSTSSSPTEGELGDLPSLAGARASSPDWIPSSTPDAAATTTGLDTGTRVERSVPASAARSMVDPDGNEPTSTLEPTAELPAVGPGDGIDVVVNGSPAAEDALDTADGRAPIFVGLAAITLLGGYLFRAKGRRRKTVLQNRHPGRRPGPAKRRTRTLTRRLAAAAEPGHPEFVNLGLRALGRLLNDLPPEALPRISGVWVSQSRLVLALADDSPPRPPPAPFTPFADGSGWSLARSSFDEVRAIARGANGPLPLLTTVGTTTALDLALTTNSRAPAEAYGLASSLLFAVDLEAGRVISVDGRPVEVIETLTTMAIELATSETADQAEIICVGFGHRLATFDRVIVVDDLSAIMSDLEEVTSRAVYAAGDASPFATRVRDGAADTWNPVIVFHADPDDPDAEDLVELAERTDGGVTVVCGYPADSGWRFLVDGDDVNCPDLPGSLADHRFNRPRLGEADAIVDLFDDEVDDIDLDDDFWSPLDDDELSPSWRSLPAVTVPGRPGGPAGPSTDPDLPPLTLRHSVEHRSDVLAPPEAPPAPSRPATPDRQDTSEVPPPVPVADDTPAPSPGGRHLYVVGDRGGETIGPITDDPDPSGRRTGPGDAPPDAGPRSGVDGGDDAGVGVDEAGPSPEPGDDPGVDVLRINVLGNFTIAGRHVGDRAKPWKYTKTPELILYLLLHPGGASQDLLMEQLFPEQPTNRPRLNQLVSDARTKALGADRHGQYHLPHASPSDPFYKLTAGVSFDLRDFAHHCAKARRADSIQVGAREWQAALELVTGRPFTVPHDGYGWAIPEIEATIVKVEEAAVALADIAMELGDHRLAVWATKKGLLTGTGYYELLVKRGRAALLLEDPEEIVRAFADLQLSLDHTGAPEEGMPDLAGHPDLADVYNDLSDGGRGRDRTP